MADFAYGVHGIFRNLTLGVSSKSSLFFRDCYFATAPFSHSNHFFASLTALPDPDGPFAADASMT